LKSIIESINELYSNQWYTISDVIFTGTKWPFASDINSGVDTGNLPIIIVRDCCPVSCMVSDGKQRWITGSLGKNTDTVALGMRRFNPDAGWKKSD